MVEKADLLQGTLDMLILKALEVRPEHGFGVARWIERVTGERLIVEEGALYPALYRMQKRGWVESEWGVSDNNRRARYYSLTDEGRLEFARQTKSWSESADAVRSVLEASGS